jgi:hypothetical protein
VDSALVRRLAALYPPEWQARYGTEFADLLESYPSGFSTIANVAWWALRERVTTFRTVAMNPRQRTVSFLTYAVLTAAAAGINFYWTVDGTPMANAMARHDALRFAFNAVARGGFGLVALAAFGAASVAFTWIRTGAAMRWKEIAPLAAGPFFAISTLAWIAAAMAITGTHWVPTPWDVTGDWAAPSAWPPEPVRWLLASITTVLLIVTAVSTAIGVRVAISRRDVAARSDIWLKVTAAAITATVLAMTCGITTWGWFSQQYASVPFHGHNGGFFATSNFMSWQLSVVLFLFAAVTALRGTRSAWTPAA